MEGTIQNRDKFLIKFENSPAAAMTPSGRRNNEKCDSGGIS